MKDEALRLALQALGHFEKAGLATLKTIDAITAIKEALEQERALQALHDENERLGLYKDAYEQPEPVIDHSAAVRIATSLGWTPKREWQGLTDDEYSQLHDGLYQQGKSLGWVVDQIEEKLKERNL